MGERNEILRKAFAQRNMAGGLTEREESGLPHRGLFASWPGRGVESEVR